MGNEALERLLNLSALLLDATRPLTFVEIRDKLPTHYRQANSEAARRQFERDKEDLIEMGVHLEVTSDGTESTYRATRAKELGDLDLSPSELAALHFAATRVAVAGITDAQVIDGIQKLGGVVGAGGPRLAEVPVPEQLDELFEAARHQATVTFTYNGVAREVEPHRIEFERGNWYVSGFDRTRDAGRSYRVDRIEGRVAVGAHGSFRRADRSERVELAPWALGDGEAVEATVLLDAEVAPLFLAEYPTVDKTVHRGGRGVTVRLPTRHAAGLFSVVLTYLDRAEITGPAALRAQFVDYLESFASDD